MSIRYASLCISVVASFALFAACESSGTVEDDTSTGGRAGAAGTGHGGMAGKGSKGGSGGTGGSTVPDGGVCANGEQKACGTDVGACAAGIQKCANGVWGQCLNAVGPAQEQCDGKDHDCDGTPNNKPGGCDCTDGETQSCYDGPTGTEGKGTCKAGTQTCAQGVWGACTGVVKPEDGKCDKASCLGGPNAGCDCIIGEFTSCYSGDVSTKDVGICKAGTQVCKATATGAAWEACSGEVLPEAEECDGADHNCDGTPNNPAAGCTCSAGSNQSCYTGPSSTLGQGTCKEGTQACTLTGGKYVWGPCTGEIAPVQNDCDHPSCVGAGELNPGCTCLNGTNEACYTGPQGTQNVGTCSAGSRACAAGGWGECKGQTLPAALDACVAAGAPYDAVSDLDCSSTLDRHDPEVLPTVAAPAGTQITPLPAGMAAAIRVLPLETLTFQATATDVDGATGTSYRWRLISAPTGNTAGLSGAPGALPNDVSTEASPTLFAQLVGDYVVGVNAVDATGCRSAEAQILVQVRPNTSVHVELTWSGPVDMDLHMVNDDAATFGDPDTCYWGATNPDWGTVDPSLDIDDLAGCNPENISFGEANGPLPQKNSTYAIFVHYYCEFRGHRTTVEGDPTALCYDKDTYTSDLVTATVKVYVDGQLAKIDGTNQDAVFSAPLEYFDTWKPAAMRYDNNGVWRVTKVNEFPGWVTGCEEPTYTGCTCAGAVNETDPYCGPGGAQCRELYP